MANGTPEYMGKLSKGGYEQVNGLCPRKLPQGGYEKRGGQRTANLKLPQGGYDEY